MKRKILFLLIIQVLFSIETIFAQITFQKTFGGIGYDNSYSVQQTTDGGYIVFGTETSFSTGNYNYYLIKTDVNGDSLWTKTYGGINNDEGIDAKQTADGGFIITGHSNTFGSGGFDVYLVKTDANGNSLWTKTYGGANDDEGFSVEQTADGGYIIAGWTNSFGGGNYDVYLIKTDSNGNSAWTKTFGGTGDEHGYSVQQTTDGGYIIAGYTTSFGAGFSAVYLIRTDTNGNSLWTKTFGGGAFNDGYSVQQTTDGGYIIAGETNSFGAGSFDAYIVKTDANGDSLWTKTIGGTNFEEVYSIKQTTDGGYIMTGQTYSFATSSADVYLIKTDTNGNSLWTKTFGGPNDDYGAFVQQTMDGGYIITGRTNSFGAGVDDVYLIKIDSMGNSGCNVGSIATIVTAPATQVTNPATIVTSPPTLVTTPSAIVGNGGIVSTLCTSVGIQSPIGNPKSEISVSPNPFSNEINITGTANELSEIILYDITSGRLLQQTFTNSTSINTSQLSKGIYFYEVRNKNSVIGKGKVVKE